MPLSWETFALTPLQQRKGIHHFFMHEVNDFTFNSCWKMNFTPQLQQLQVGADVMRVVNRCDPHLLYLSELRFFHKQSIKKPRVSTRGFHLFVELSYIIPPDNLRFADPAHHPSSALATLCANLFHDHSAS